MEATLSKKIYSYLPCQKGWKNLPRVSSMLKKNEYTFNLFTATGDDNRLLQTAKIQMRWLIMSRVIWIQSFNFTYKIISNTKFVKKSKQTTKSRRRFSSEKCRLRFGTERVKRNNSVCKICLPLKNKWWQKFWLSCSKLTMLLVNISLKLWLLNMAYMLIRLLKKCE